MKKLKIKFLLLYFGSCLLILPGSKLSAAKSPDPFSGMFGPPGDSGDFHTILSPAGRSGDPDLTENRLRSTWVVSDTPTETWTLTQSASYMRLSHPLVLKNSGGAVPDSLWDVSAGAGYRKILTERKEWGFSGGLGSASNELFHSRHETTLRATGSYRIPAGPLNSWVFFLAYSNNRHFLNNVPLPGAGYMIHSADNRLDAVVGFPFLFLSLRPTGKTSLRMSVFGPSNISAEGAVFVAGPVQAYAGFDWNQKEWLLAGRSDLAQRLFYEQMRWLLGVRLPAGKTVRLDAGGGYAFHRRFYEHESSTSDPVPEANLNSNWFLQLKGSLKWGDSAPH